MSAPSCLHSSEPPTCCSGGIYATKPIAPINTILGVHCPTLLVHGSGDDTVPFKDAERLATASPHARLLLVDGGHDLRAAMGEHAQTLVDFLHAACTATKVGAEPGQALA